MLCVLHLCTLAACGRVLCALRCCRRGSAACALLSCLRVVPRRDTITRAGCRKCSGRTTGRLLCSTRHQVPCLSRLDCLGLHKSAHAPMPCNFQSLANRRVVQESQQHTATKRKLGLNEIDDKVLVCGKTSVLGRSWNQAAVLTIQEHVHGALHIAVCSRQVEACSLITGVRYSFEMFKRFVVHDCARVQGARSTQRL